MSNDGLASFDVGTLDLGSFANEQQMNGKSRPLTQPGIYDFEVTRHKLTVNQKSSDGAGKLWGSLYLSAQTVENHYFISDFISVPLEALDYTNKSNKKTSPIRTKIFMALVGAITGQQITVSNLKNHIENLGAMLEGAIFKAEVGYKPGARVSYLKDEQGDNKFGIILRSVDGVETTYKNIDGSTATYATRDEAKQAYIDATGVVPSQGLSFLKFLRA